MLDQKDGEAAAVADGADLGGERVHLLVVQARRRLVEQEQLRLDRERPGELDALADPERQLPDRPVGDAGEAELLDQRVRPLGDPPLLARGEGQREGVGEKAAARERMGADPDVVARGHGGEQRDVLKGAGDPERGDLVPGDARKRPPVEHDRPGNAGRRGARCS